MARSVDTKYATTPEEQIFGVDPFKAISNTTLNNIVTKNDSFGSGFGNLLGVTGDIAATAGVISFITTGKLDKDYIVNKLGSTLKIDTSFIAKTPIANAGKLLQSVGLIDEKTAGLLSGKDSSMSLVDIYTTVHNGYKTTVNNVDKIIKDEMFDSFSNFTNAILSINPNVANLINTIGLGEELALLKSIVGQTVDLQIPGLIDLLIKDIKDEKTQKAVLVQSIPDAIGNGNTELIDVALDYLGPNVIMGLYPNILTDILKGYRESSETANLSLHDRGVKLISILMRFKTDWAYTYRNGVKVANLDVFRDCSEAAKKVLSAWDDEVIQSSVMIANNFKPAAPLVIAKKYYPYI